MSRFSQCLQRSKRPARGLLRASFWLGSSSLPACSLLIDVQGDGIDSRQEFEPIGTGGATDNDPNEVRDGTGGDDSEPPDPIVALPRERHHWKLDEVSGSAAPDIGYGMLEATTVQSENWSPQSGVVGGAFEIKPGHNFLQTQNSVVPSGGAFSLSWWVSPATDDPMYLLSKQGGAGQGGFYVAQIRDGIRLASGGAGDEVFFDSKTPLPDGRGWNHVALTYRRNVASTDDRLRLYLNAELVIDEFIDLSIGSSTPENQNQIMRVGIVDGGTWPMFVGLVDEVRIHEIELDEFQVSTLYRFDRGQIEAVEYFDPRSGL